MTIAIRIEAPEQKDNWKAAALGCLGFLCRLWVAGAWLAAVFVIGAVCIGAASALLAAAFVGMKWLVTVSF